MYAITSTSYRAIARHEDLLPGEVAAETIPLALIDAMTAMEVRRQRDTFLTACDWTVGADSPLNDEQIAAWRAYRKALRDVPAQPGFPHAVEWPTPPSTR